MSRQKVQKRPNKCWYTTRITIVPIVPTLKKKKKKNKISLKKGYTGCIVQLVANLLINLSKIVPLGGFGKGYNGYNNAFFPTQMPYLEHNV